MEANRSEIESKQLEKLQRLLFLVCRQNQFHKQKLLCASGSTEISSLLEFSQRIPFTTKEELVRDQSCTPPYGSNLTFPTYNYTRYSQTSGTSGHPLRWLDTPESWELMIANWLTIFQVGGISSKDRLFIPFSFGPFLGFWTAFEAAVRLGCLCIPGGGFTTLARLKCILDNGINVICCTPTYAVRLALVAREENLDLSQSNVKSIIVAGEPGGSLPKTREYIETLWKGATVIDHHGMTEIGPASYQCPVYPGLLHIIESAYYPEVVDHASSQPVAPGCTGELIITTLDRLGSPVIRYRTGDLVKLKKDQIRCACGSNELSLDGGILGRFDDMISVRGVNIFPSAIDNIVRKLVQVNEYRGEVREEKGMTELTLQIEIDSTCVDSAGVCRQLEREISTAFSIRIPVVKVAPGTLPRFEMKARRWIRR